MLAGRVLDASVPGFFMPLPGARVLARPDCLPRQAFEAITDAEGRYQLTVPADYATACESIELGARAEGFEPWQATIATSALRADPQRTIQLFRAKHAVTLWLPWLARSALR